MSDASHVDGSTAWPTVSAGYSHVPAGHLASVVTFLEMRTRPPRRDVVAPVGWSLRQMQGGHMESYRAVFAAVGERWLWFSRLTLDGGSLRAILDDADVQALGVCAPDSDSPVGLLELDFRDAGACELAFLGLTPPYQGRGVGRWLMEEVMERAWNRPGIERVHVHTCTLDHPAALPFYVRSGFAVVRRAIEVAPDPRVLGLLPADAAPDVPLAVGV